MKTLGLNSLFQPMTGEKKGDCWHVFASCGVNYEGSSGRITGRLSCSRDSFESSNVGCGCQTKERRFPQAKAKVPQISTDFFLSVFMGSVFFIFWGGARLGHLRSQQETSRFGVILRA